MKPGRTNDGDLERLFERLPRYEATADFTERVLAKLDERAASPRRGPWRGLAVAAVLTALSTLAGSELVSRYERQRAEARVEALREEYRALERELEALRSLTRDAEPVLELGGTDDVEFIFDLRELANPRSDPRVPYRHGTRAEPASHSTGGIR